MTRKRAPGGGRKPKGEFQGKSATLTTRITPETRQGLEREARRNGRSLSQEVEKRLNDSLKAPNLLKRTLGAPHVSALCQFIARNVSSIEFFTERSWNEDKFTAEAVRIAVDHIIRRLGPDGELEVPDRVEQSAQKNAEIFPDLTPEQHEFYRRPECLATSVVLGLFDSPT